MKLNFPKIIHTFDLAEYAPEWGGQQIHIWVNPPSDLLANLADANKIVIDIESKKKFKQEDLDAARRKYLEHLSAVLCEGPDNKLSVDDLYAMYEATESTDPSFWMWFQIRVIDEINDHRLGQKKA